MPCALELLRGTRGLHSSLSQYAVLWPLGQTPLSHQDLWISLAMEATAVHPD